jgi:hypothetical protein
VGSSSVYERSMGTVLQAVRQPHEAVVMVRLLCDEGIVGKGLRLHVPHAASCCCWHQKCTAVPRPLRLYAVRLCEALSYQQR